MAEMSYKKAGVDIERAEAFVKRMKSLIERTL
jgi:phosphoribosylaminoimidazole (AIR) synthetase